jgi:hypothetical protein
VNLAKCRVAFTRVGELAAVAGKHLTSTAVPAEPVALRSNPQLERMPYCGASLSRHSKLSR